MIKHILTTLFLFLAINIASGQEWLNMQNEGKSFKEIKASMNKKFAGKSTLKSLDNYDRSYKKYARWEHFWKYQLDEQGRFVSPQKVWDSYEEAKGLQSKYKLKAGTADWSYLGPDTIPTATEPTYAGMGRLNCITFHPSDVNTFWVGAANGGLWKTTDGGSTWATAGGDMPVLGISDIAIAADDPMTMYIATGDADAGHSTSVGILKSTDGGASFVATGFTNAATSDSTAKFQIHHLWIHPTMPDTLVLTSTAGIYRTTNGGTSWTQIDANATTDLKAKPGDPTVLYAGSFNSLIKSADGGVTWNEKTTLTGAQKIDIAVSAADPAVVYIVSDNGNMAKSTDSGENWTPVTAPGGYNTQQGYNMAIVVAPNNAAKVMLVGVAGYVSTNSGVTWTKHLNGVWLAGDVTSKYVHSDHHMLKYQPGSNDIIFSCHDGGVHKGDFHSLAAPWTDLSHGLFITQYYNIDGTPQELGTMIGGAQDQDGSFLKAGGWKNINNNSDGIGGAIDHSNSSISFCQSQEGYMTRTLDNWVTPQDLDVMQSDPSNDKADFVWPLEMDPKTASTLYAGYGNIYKTTNSGDNWTSVTGHTGNYEPYTSISVSPVRPDTVYAVRSMSTLHVSLDGGSTWNATGTTPGVGPISKIEASVTDASTVFVTIAGYVAGSKVFKSTDAGATWVNISTGIPNMPIFTIAEKANGDLYIGTQLGVYEKSGMGDWVAFNTNLPNVSVRALIINEIGGKMRAGTFGRGMWETTFGGVTCPSVAVHNWTGTTSTDWHTATNWDTGCVPASTNTVVIPDVTNDPIISSTMTGLADNVTINANGHLTIKGGGTLTITAKNLVVEATGILTAENTSVLNVSN